MIDPLNFPYYNQSKKELEETLLFWICAAGKNGVTAAKLSDKFLTQLGAATRCRNPFNMIKKYGSEHLALKMKTCGIGCYKMKSRAFWQVANSNLNLKTCNRDELMAIHGIGMKTASCFILHSRKEANCAGLDIHILRYLKNMGYDVPDNTPGNKKKYIEIENIFLDLVPQHLTPAQFDIQIWLGYHQKTAA